MRYGKGLRNYGSHLVDLLIDWYGQVASVEAFGLVGDGPDPALSFRCRMQARFDAVLLALSGLEYDQFEIDVFYRDRRLELRNGGCEKLIHRPVQGLYYPGYSQLGAPSDIVPPAPVTGLAILYSAVRDHLEQGAPLEGCLPEQALHGQVVLETALRSASKGRELPIPAEFTTSWAQA
jgi:predicted dehydrogenase